MSCWLVIVIACGFPSRRYGMCIPQLGQCLIVWATTSHAKDRRSDPLSNGAGFWHSWIVFVISHTLKASGSAWTPRSSMQDTERHGFERRALGAPALSIII